MRAEEEQSQGQKSVRRAMSVRRVPQSIGDSKDARSLFSYLLRQAALWPEYSMAPKKGPVKRVVLFTRGFNDRTVASLSTIKNLDALLKEVREVRLVATAVTTAGARRLQRLIPDTKVNLVSDVAWMNNVQTSNPNYDLETGKCRKAPKLSAGKRRVLKARLDEMWRQRYGPSAKKSFAKNLDSHRK